MKVKMQVSLSPNLGQFKLAIVKIEGYTDKLGLTKKLSWQS